MSRQSGSITPGTSVGRYRVDALIGSGGMGEVYSAVDQQLGREIALKILAQAPADRFVREARLASSLNDPAIVTVFDSGSATIADGRTVHFLAMERVDGEPLTQWTRSHRDARKIAELFASVADGLARAHAGGIAHRDLKPQNILVTRAGHPKILDFGIAKLVDRGAGAAADTGPSHAIGTAAYMSPEQVEGVAVDARTDIFSFGTLLSEALSGKAPFLRANAVESMHAVLHDEPADPPVAPEIARIVRKCLVKDREERYQSIKDVAIDLREFARDSRAAQRRRRIPAVATIAATVLVIVIAVIGVDRGRRAPAAIAAPPPPEPVMMRLTNSGNVSAGAVSPDGKYVVYSTIDGENQTVWVKQIATGTNVRIVPPATDIYYNFRVSPDGNYVFYTEVHRSEPNVVDLRSLPILGGESRLVAHDVEPPFALSPDGRKAACLRFNVFERLYRVVTIDVETGAETGLVARPYPGFVGRLDWAPDGRTITFVGMRANVKPPRPGLFSLDVATRRVTPIATPEWGGISGVAWLPDGSGMLLTVSDKQQPRQIWFLPRDGSPAKKITSDISVYGAMTVTSDSHSIVAYRASGTANLFVIDKRQPQKPRALTTGMGNCFGTAGVEWLSDAAIAYTVCGNEPSLNVIDAATGESRQLLRGAFWQPVVSPDRTRMALISERSGTEELWVSDLNGNATQVTNGRGPLNCPSWSPDGRTIYFMSNGQTQFLWRTTLDGKVELVLPKPVNMPDVSPDGKSVLCRLRSTDPKTQLWQTAVVPLGGGAPKILSGVPHSGGPPVAKWVKGTTYAYLDSIGGVPNVWIDDLERRHPMQVTHFDSGEILAYDFSADGRSVVVSHAEEVNDLVLIRDFR